MRTYLHDINADFTCKHCEQFVSARSAASGVIHRNHCPYCLHSRHVDLFKSGDRLCACKALMTPVGLTLKNSRDKYAREPQGELMLIHLCTTCGALSINRIAADDDPVKLIAVFTHSQKIDPNLKQRCEVGGIQLLKLHDHTLVRRRLYGTVTKFI